MEMVSCFDAQAISFGDWVSGEIWKITFIREIIFIFAKTIIQVGTIEKTVISGAYRSSYREGINNCFITKTE